MADSALLALVSCTSGTDSRKAKNRVSRAQFMNGTVTVVEFEGGISLLRVIRVNRRQDVEQKVREMRDEIAVGLHVTGTVATIQNQRL